LCCPALREMRDATDPREEPRVRVGACTRSQRGRRDSVCPVGEALVATIGVDFVARPARHQQSRLRAETAAHVLATLGISASARDDRSADVAGVPRRPGGQAGVAAVAGVAVAFQTIGGGSVLTRHTAVARSAYKQHYSRSGGSCRWL
jgi:hypothetical protein